MRAIVALGHHPDQGSVPDLRMTSRPFLPARPLRGDRVLDALSAQRRAAVEADVLQQAAAPGRTGEQLACRLRSSTTSGQDCKPAISPSPVVA
jgi:hypothetical protein